ncbi:MAG: hypothetical protein JWO38_1799 [Gemmataceae bacterium]|nr:hypothetical protein [Gemmataceae bacterium]
MYLIIDHRLGLRNFVFILTDPRKEGYKGDVDEGVSLDYDVLAIPTWPDGEQRPEPNLGRDPTNPKRYKVFKFPRELREARFEFVDSKTPVVDYSWQDYLEKTPMPSELAEKLGPDNWSDYLDKVDEGVRLRRQKNVEPEPPRGSNRDRIAEWVAKRHMSVDGSIRQVLYLPDGAPDEEIRLLEVNDRITRSAEEVEPIDFGIEIAGMPLSVCAKTRSPYDL